MTKRVRLYFFISVCIPLFVVIGRWQQGGWEISHFIVAGERNVNPEEHPYPIKINRNSAGYDGQYFYHLALNPFTSSGDELGFSTNLSYRKQRILYPLVSHFLAFGNPHWVPWTMVLSNLLAYLFMLFIITRIVNENDRDPAFILLFALFSGAYIALTRNLCEVYEGLFVVMAFYCFHRKWMYGFVISSLAALLSREVSLLIVLPGILIWVYDEFNERKLTVFRLFLLLSPGALWLLWKFYLVWTLGQPLSGTGGFTPIPFKGLFDAGSTIISGNLHAGRHNIQSHLLYAGFCLFYLIWYVVTIFLAKKSSQNQYGRTWRWLKAVWWIWIVFMIFFASAIYRSDLSFGRVLSSFAIICFFMILLNNKRIPKMYLLYTGFVGIVVIARLILMT